MSEYALHLESGPKMRTTMAHVFGLLGCTASGPTTGEALEAAPEEIRRFLQFLRDHGETVDLRSKITTSVAAHVMEGSWIGYGDPVPGFAPDFGPLTTKERDLDLRRLDWMREDFGRLLAGVSAKQLAAKPALGRSLRPIAEHVAGADASYLRATVGPFAELREATKAVERAEVPLTDALRSLWAVSHARLAAMDEDERTRMVQRGEKQWTARRGMRRMLEHQWEHLREVERRLRSRR